MAARQRGQVLVIVAALLAALTLAFVHLFNVGQLVTAKSRLNAAADAAAFSAAVWEARSLNYQAYLNRGIVANEAAIAQLVSLRSWSTYFGRLLTNVSLVSNIVPPVGRVVHALARAWGAVDRSLQTVLPPLEGGLSRWNVDVLLRAQSLAQQQAAVGAADLVAEVARANVPEAAVAVATRAHQVRNAAGLSRLSEIRHRGGGDLREYVQLLADSRDGFTAERIADLLPANPALQVPKRGGTDLIGEYAWRGADTLASHLDLVLTDIEVPIGWGAAETRRLLQRQQGVHGGSRRANPRTTRLALAGSNVREGYRGVPEFRDVRGRPDEEAARLPYVVVLEAPSTFARLADSVLGTRSVEDTTGLLHSTGVEGAPPLRSTGAAEVYFRRPDARRDGREERPSLFSPYWQARLTALPSWAARAAASAAP